MGERPGQPRPHEEADGERHGCAPGSGVRLALAHRQFLDPRGAHRHDQAERDATERFDLLDLWVAKSFDIGEMPAKVKVGNQVISWGAEIFVPGGINQINALSLPKYHTPGTQLKEVFIPAPMASFNIGLTETLSLEGYYQFKWNAYSLDPVGTYFSSADIAGEGRRPIYYPTNYVNNIYGPLLGLTCADLTPTGQCGAPGISGLSDADLVAFGLAIPYAGEREAKNSGQYGVALRWTAESIGTDFGLFYQRYHDKTPFVGYTARSNPNNLVVDNVVGVHLSAGSTRNVVEGNDFIGNREQVRYVGARDERWGVESGNHWANYLGWDRDGNGVGDVPYEANDMVDRLSWRYPSMKLLLASPAVQALRLVGQQFPILRVPSVVDPKPRMVPTHQNWSEWRGKHFPGQ